MSKPTPLTPPFAVNVLTDNLRTCRLIVTDADGVERAIIVPNDGNVYQGLHAIKAELGELFADVLAAHGVLPAAPPAAPTADALPATQPEPAA